MSAGLVLQGVSKRFGALAALDSVSVTFRMGELCGLAGHNGAGKSTLLNILCGAFAPDQGRIELHGSAYRPRNYREAMRAGVFRVSQELTLFDNLTVAANISVGLERFFTRGGFLDQRAIARDLGRFLDRIGLDVLPLGQRVGGLPLALKQLTEITRCLFSAAQRGIEAPVLLFDEPTSGLTHTQAGFVASHLRQLTSGAIIILTSHRGSELLDLSQRTVVMRDGRLVADRPSEALDIASLEEAMAGAPRARTMRTPGVAPSGPEVLTVAGIGGGSRLAVRRGEVVGLAGEGEDKSQILAAIAGWRRDGSLEVRVSGTQVPCTARARARAGMRYVPGERAREGFSVWQPVTWNVTLPGLARSRAHDRLARRPAEERRVVGDMAARYGIRVPDVRGPIAALSGGNQQRLLVARSLDPDALVLLCDRPTRGVDMMATAEVHAAIRAAAAAGLACLVTSDEPEELASLCDRVASLRADGLGDLPMTGRPDEDAARIVEDIAV